jgi:hypothetical protein
MRRRILMFATALSLSGAGMAPNTGYALAHGAAAQAEQSVSLPGIDLLAPVRAVTKWMATVFTNAGAAIVTNRIIQSGTAPKNIGWGTGTTAAAVGDTVLQTEVAPTTAGGRTVGSESRTTITNTNDNYQVTGTVTQNQAGPVAITEAGLFDAVSTGNMLIHSVYSAVNTSLNDSIAYTFGLKFVPG